MDEQANKNEYNDQNKKIKQHIISVASCIGRKTIKYLGILLSLILVVMLGYITIQFVHLKLWIGNEQIVVKELTKNQKEEDFTYLAKFVEEVYPFSEELQKVKGIPNLSELSSDYIRRAGETHNNEEYLLLFLEYTERLRQAGHGGIQFPDYSLFTSYTFDIPKDAFYKGEYWQSLLSNIQYYAHSELDIMYQDGHYYVIANNAAPKLNIEVGAIVEAVNGVPVDEWVKRLEAEQPLIYDNYHNKVYTQHLFMRDPGKDIKGWEVSFKHKDGTVSQLFLDKLSGYKEDINAFFKQSHVYCTNLQDSVGYIYIPNFFMENINQDGQSISEFMSSNSVRLNKLIIDIRGNQGGEETYWLNNIIRPLIGNETELHSKTAVKKGFISRMNLRLAYYRATATNHLLHPKSHYVSSVSTTTDPSIDSDIWKVYDITQKLSPTNSFNFNGKIIVLMDTNSISAADSFASAMKQLGLATLAGNPSGGWGNHYISPVLFALPNSGLCFRSDVELSYNVDGRPTSIYGTMPDVFLKQHPYPSELTKEALLSDEWISWAVDY